jgi:glycosyltransferase involved in cell wall biosynthesis
MHIVFFTHPAFLGSQSMSRYARMLSEGMSMRGHSVEIWTAQPYFSRLPLSGFLKKWLGYIDQFIVFPLEVKQKLKKQHADTLFVFTDHALGPWVSLVADRKHVIHCHDFLAQQSALGMIPENPTGWSGRKYQAFIRSGYRKGKNFISISKKTQADLHHFLDRVPSCSEVVYNGLNQSFEPGNTESARLLLSTQIELDLASGYLLHVGGNQFYKNRTGVLEIYNAWRKSTKNKLPLLMIGSTPSLELKNCWEQSPYKDEIYFLNQIDDQLLRLAYQAATVFLFPSLAEGFGWPIAEAMASGCPVITTAEAPMSEVAGNAGFLIPCKPLEKSNKWAVEAAKTVESIVSMNNSERELIIQKGLENANRFDSQNMLNQIEAIYKKLIQ